MKTNTLKTIIGTTLALTIAAAVWLPARAQGSDQIKGAQRLLQSGQTASIAAAPTPVNPAKMACAKCSDVLDRVTRIEKGHIRTESVVERHVCPGCNTTIDVVGMGNAKKNVVNHTCSAPGAAAASCCSTKTGG